LLAAALVGAFGLPSVGQGASAGAGQITVRGPGTLGDNPDPGGGPVLAKYTTPASCVKHVLGKATILRVRMKKGARELGFHVNGYHGAGMYDLDYGDTDVAASFTNGTRGFYATSYPQPADRTPLSGWVEVHKKPLRVFIRSVMFRYRTGEFVYAFGVLRCA
jgi:hypothetical protein